MRGAKFCPLCNRDVMGTKKFNWPIFLFLLITFIGPAFYLLWYIFKPRNICPICGAKLISKTQKEQMAKYCPKCGSQSVNDISCPHCGHVFSNPLCSKCGNRLNSFQEKGRGICDQCWNKEHR